MPMPKPVCRTNLYDNIVQLEVCITFSGRGMGINGTAQTLISILTIITIVILTNYNNYDINGL